jgi:hypothetical protein
MTDQSLLEIITEHLTIKKCNKIKNESTSWAKVAFMKGFVRVRNDYSCIFKKRQNVFIML